MDDLSLHILDIVENAIEAEATRVEIRVEEDIKNNTLRISIKDNGKGMLKEEIARLRDPFFTTKNKKTGLGIPLLCQSAHEAAGEVRINSIPGKGTEISATFQLDHIDRKPLGDLASTLIALISGHPEVDFIFEYRKNNKGYLLDTEEIKRELDGVPINYPGVIKLLKGIIKEGIKELMKGG
ncbi:MAG: sensor histidine kinase [Nitrospirae bacterium]|nr:sensor histidine kinase [Nitrospirota bacterium]